MMDAYNERLLQVYSELLEMPTNERTSYLEQLESDEAPLVQQLRTMLSSDQDEGKFDALIDDFDANTPQEIQPNTQAEEPSLDRSTGKYEIKERLGSGGMGVVFKAFDTQLKRNVALKFLKDELTADEEAKSRHLVEAQAAAALDHPNICVIFETGETDDGKLFIAMPYYEGQTLREKISQGPLPFGEAVDYIRQAVAGLSAAHAAGIVHRDIKPANLLVTSDGTVKILDFGIAKRTEDHLTDDGSRMGTLAYMSPEQLQNEPVDQRTDVWALGMVFFELLTGSRPFQGEYEYALMYALLHEDPISLHTLKPEIPPIAEDVIGKALQKRQDDRFQRVEDILTALDTGATTSSPAQPPTQDASPATTHRFTPEGERIRATVVATGISGYFDMVEELAPDHLNRLLSDLEQQITNIVVQHQGMVYTFGGDEMVLLFGVTKSQEDDGLRAIQAIRELHQLAATYSENFVLQSAVASGSLVARSKPDDPTSLEVTGKLMSLVRRIAGRAEEDTVLLEGETVRLVRSHYEVTENGSLSVRGKGAPLPLYELGGKRDQVSPVHGDIERGLTVFTGRQRELDMIQRCYERVLGGEGQFVTLNGEAGLGKSRLSYEFRNSLKEEDVTLLMGRCQSYSSQTPYAPFLEVLRSIVGLVSSQSVDANADQVVLSVKKISNDLEDMIPLFLHLLGITHHEYVLPDGVEAANLRRAINESISALFIALSHDQPIVLVLDDWHWSDKGSQDVLKNWVDMLEPYRALVLLTYRPSHTPNWGHPECHTSIRLRPLEGEHVETIIQRLLNAETIPQTLTNTLIERTEGNPFFLEELINSMLEAKQIEVINQELHFFGNVDRTTIPGSVQAVLRTRIERLPESSKNILLAASVIGRTFTLSLLEEVLPDADTLHDDLDIIRQRGLLQQTKVLPEIEYRFKHALIQEVVYDSLLSHQRKKLHNRVGIAMESFYPSLIDEQPFRLMNHFMEAEKWEKAISYAETAAILARDALQYNESITVNNLILSWATYLDDTEATRLISIRTLQQLDKLYETMFHRQERRSCLASLFSFIDHDKERALSCDYYIRKADLLIEEYEIDEATESLEIALEIAETAGDKKLARKALKSKGWLHWVIGKDQEARKISEQILESQRKEGYSTEIFGTLVNLTSLESRHNNFEIARSYIEEALTYLHEKKLSFDHASILYYLGRVEFMQGNPEKAEQVLNQAMEAWDYLISEKANYSILTLHPRVPQALTLMGNIKFAQKKYEEAEFYYNKYLKFQESELGRKDEYAGILLVLGNFMLRSGRLSKAIEYLEKGFEVHLKHDIKLGLVNICTSLAIAYEQQENFPGAYVYWEKLQSYAVRYNDEEYILKALEGKVRVARLQKRDLVMIIQLQQDVLGHAETYNLREKQAEIHNTLGILEWNRGHTTDALSHFTTAYDLFTELDDAIHAGLMLNSIGAAQAKLDLIDEAVDTFQRALTHHDQTGEKLLKGHALAALGDIERDRGNYQQALTHYGDSLQLRWDIEDRAGEGWMLERIGKIHILEEKLPEARKELQKALEIAQECGESKLQLACQQSLSNLS